MFWIGIATSFIVFANLIAFLISKDEYHKDRYRFLIGIYFIATLVCFK
jgi:uncharacterized membrane protein